MARVAFSPTAAADVTDIAAHIAADNAKASAALAQSPGIGCDRPELRPDLRSHPVGRYVIFYRRIRGGIGVVRVLHGMRDIDQVFAAAEEET